MKTMTRERWEALHTDVGFLRRKYQFHLAGVLEELLCCIEPVEGEVVEVCDHPDVLDCRTCEFLFVKDECYQIPKKTGPLNCKAYKPLPLGRKDALLRALGYEAGDARNWEQHWYCPECGPFVKNNGKGCSKCGCPMRNVNPGKELK